MGVVVLRRYIDIPTPVVEALFWQQHPYFFVHFKNVFRSFIYNNCIQLFKMTTIILQNVA